jgi:hypothetical protein
MFRKLLPYLLLAVFGVAGFVAWKNLNSPAPTRATAEVPFLAPLSPRRASPQFSRLIFLTDASQPYQVRIDQFRNILVDGCSEPELRFLYQLLEKAPPASELPEHWYVLANDIMVMIHTHETDPQRFSSQLIGLLNAPHQPEVIRDYAVQHLATWLNPVSSQAGATRLPAASPEIAAEVLASLAAAVTDPALAQSTVPGTTLMMLVNLTRSNSGVDCTQAIATLKPWLGEALQDGSTLANPIRVAAVSAAGILAPGEFRPLIRSIAYQENGGSSLRLPAIAALGLAGEEQDLAKLRAIAASSPELTYAAQDAVTALVSRLGLVDPDPS